MKAQRESKKDPRKAIELIEKILEANPYNPQANLILKESAIALGWPETAIFALETLLEDEPKEVKILHELGRLYLQHDNPEKAVEVYHRITEIDPLDLAAVKLGKDAAAKASIEKAAGLRPRVIATSSRTRRWRLPSRSRAGRR
jgi:tetratricopeptide (TPR) repeat protein